MERQRSAVVNETVPWRNCAEGSKNILVGVLRLSQHENRTETFFPAVHHKVHQHQRRRRSQCAIVDGQNQLTFNTRPPSHPSARPPCPFVEVPRVVCEADWVDNDPTQLPSLVVPATRKTSAKKRASVTRSLLDKGTEKASVALYDGS